MHTGSTAFALEISALKAAVREKDAEIKRLKAANTDLQRECEHRGMRIADLERLLARAADALEKWNIRHRFSDIVAQLRKAAG